MALDFKHGEVRLLVPRDDFAAGILAARKTDGLIRRAQDLAADLNCNLVIEIERPLITITPAIPGTAILGFSPARAARRQTVAA